MWVRAAGVGEFLIELGLGLSSGSMLFELPYALRRPRLPDNETAPVDLPPSYVEGVGNWLPPHWGKQGVACGLNAATINPKGFEGSDVEVPLRRLRITDARPKARWSRRRYATANCVVTLTEGADSVALTGPWLTLAWIGHLANWPEPPR